MKNRLPVKARQLGLGLNLLERNTTTVERAFQVANSGHCATVQDIRRYLKIEGYSDMQVTGPSLLKQLKAILKAAR
jgi:hypothetical protein